MIKLFKHLQARKKAINPLSKDPKNALLQSAYNLSLVLEAEGEREIAKEIIALASRQYILLERIEKIQPKSFMEKQSELFLKLGGRKAD